MSGNEKTYKATGTTNRGIAEAIDELICVRIAQSALSSPDAIAELDEQAEVVLRVITDALEERDLRKGVIVAPDVGHP